MADDCVKMAEDGKMADNSVWIYSNAPTAPVNITIPNNLETYTLAPKNYELVFYDNYHSSPQKEVGRLSVNDDGKITFSGYADASAKVFFDEALKYNNAVIERYRRALKRIASTPTDETSKEIAKSELENR